MKLDRRNWLRTLSLGSAGALFGLNKSYASGNPDCLTTDDIEGPFYIEGAPVSPQLAPESAPGTPLFITGTVYANDCMTPVKEALCDVWHANDAGGYEDVDYRGKVLTDESGQYSFQTILPGKYLNGSQFRPRHFHYKVSSMDVELTTQIYFEGDTSIPIDPWASLPEAEERIIPLVEDDNNNLHGVADIYLDVEPVITNGTRGSVSPNSPHIRHIFPNPLNTEGQVAIWLPQSAAFSLDMYDLKGRLVKRLAREDRLSAGEHMIALNRNSQLGIKLTTGLYIVRLAVDGRAVQAKRLMLV